MASGPITSWRIDEETMETVADFIFLGSKITADGDCSREIKRCLLLERKVWKFGIGMYTLLYLKWITNKDLQYSTENSAQCYVAAWMRGECGRECIHIYT